MNKPTSEVDSLEERHSPSPPPKKVEPGPLPHLQDRSPSDFDMTFKPKKAVVVHSPQKGSQQKPVLETKEDGLKQPFQLQDSQGKTLSHNQPMRTGSFSIPDGPQRDDRLEKSVFSENMGPLLANASTFYPTYPQQSPYPFTTAGYMYSAPMPPMMLSSPWVPQQQIQAPQVGTSLTFGDNQSDPGTLRRQVQSLGNTIAKLEEINRNLEHQNMSYATQLQRGATTFEEFKQRFYEQQTMYQAQLIQADEKISHGNKKIFEMEQEILSLRTESENLRRRFAGESSLRVRLQEQLNDQQLKLRQTREELR